MTNNTLNLEKLTPIRRKLLTDSLAGHNLELINGRFNEMSRSSLEAIGLSQIEITALEESNANDGIMQALMIPGQDASSENNPFKEDNWNPEAQRLVSESDPALTRKLMKEAGFFKN